MSKGPVKGKGKGVASGSGGGRGRGSGVPRGKSKNSGRRNGKALANDSGTSGNGDRSTPVPSQCVTQEAQ